MFPLPCMLVCSFVCANRTRDRGCSKHPVFPAPSIFEEGKTKMQTSGDQRREIAARMVGTLRVPTSACKSLLIFRNRVKSGIEKYSAFVLTQISPITPPVSPD